MNTGCDSRLSRTPARARPIPSWISPDSRDSSVTSWMNSAVPEVAMWPTLAAVSRDVMATGPVTSSADDPHNTPTMAGTIAAYKP